jgi:hypothetical protein
MPENISQKLENRSKIIGKSFLGTSTAKRIKEKQLNINSKISLAIMLPFFRFLAPF